MTATKAQRDKAESIERRVEQLSMLRVPQTVRHSMRMRSQAIAAFRRDRPIDEIVREFAAQLGESLTDATVATHLAGRLNVVAEASAAVKRKRKRRGIRALDKLGDAVQFFQDRTEVTPEQLTHLRLSYTESALDIARGFDETVGNRLRTEIATSIREGEHVRDGVVRLRGAFDSMGINGVRPHLLETIFRTQTRIAWSAGEWNADQDPAIQEILWGYTYVTVGDDRVRPSHSLLDGTTLPKNDPAWDSMTPPNGFNCRCMLIRVFDTDDQEIQAVGGAEEIDGVLVVPGPDPDFAFNPGLLHRDTISLPIDPEEAPGVAASLGPPGLPKEVLALACLIDDPTRTDMEIASKVGCSRRSLYNWPKFMAAKGAIRSGKGERRRGMKTVSGVESW